MLIQFSDFPTDNSAAKPGYTAAESNSCTASHPTLRFKMQLSLTNKSSLQRPTWA